MAKAKLGEIHFNESFGKASKNPTKNKALPNNRKEILKMAVDRFSVQGSRAIQVRTKGKESSGSLRTM